VPVEKIEPSRPNPPSRLRNDNLTVLQETIKRYRFLHYPILRPRKDSYEIVCGHRRIEAAKRAGMKTVLARVLKLDDTEALVMSILENEMREDWGPVEKVRGYAKLHKLGWSLRSIASLVGRDVSLICRYLDILELAKPVQLLTHVNGLTEGHVRWIGKLPKSKQAGLAKLVVEQKRTTRETEVLVRKVLATESRNSCSKSFISHRVCPVNDLDPHRWKEYADQYGLQYYSTWSVRRHDPFFRVSGNVYPGCFPVSVAVNCILRFSRIGDHVLDPCVGSGTTLVACAMFDRLGVGIDVNAEAKSALQRRFSLVMKREPRLKRALCAQRFILGDSRDLSFLGAASVDLAIAHPPYFGMKYYGPKGTYHHPSEYREFLRETFSEVRRVLKPQRYFCIQIAPYAAKHQPLHYLVFQVADEAGFRFADEAIVLFLDYVGYSSSASGRVSTANSKTTFGKFRSIATNSLLHNHEYLLIFTK
jgi:ParB/RepB/Spo0J family partition protein